jgi:hypothetical protein
MAKSDRAKAVRAKIPTSAFPSQSRNNRDTEAEQQEHHWLYHIEAYFLQTEESVNIIPNYSKQNKTNDTCSYSQQSCIPLEDNKKNNTHKGN